MIEDIVAALALVVLPLLFLWLFLAIITTFVASARGRGQNSWFLISLVLGPLALILLALFPVDWDDIEARQIRKLEKVPCPFCRRAIAREATACFHCRGVTLPLSHIRRQLDLRAREEDKTPRKGLRGISKANLDVIAQAIHLCAGGVPPSEVAARFGVSEEFVTSWVDRYMKDDALMRDVDAVAHSE